MTAHMGCSVTPDTSIVIKTEINILSLYIMYLLSSSVMSRMIMIKTDKNWYLN